MPGQRIQKETKRAFEQDEPKDESGDDMWDEAE